MTITQIANDVKNRCIEEYVANGIVNIADVIYDYIEEHREELENNSEFPFDEDVFAEDIALEIDEQELIEEAEGIRKTRVG